MDSIENSQWGSRLTSGVLWSGFGVVISRGLAVVTGIITARLLGKATFGEFGIIQSTLMMFATFAQFGGGLSATKHVAESRRTDPERAGRIMAFSYVLGLVTGLGGATLMLAAASLIARQCLSAPHLANTVAISSIALLFLVLNGVQNGILSGLEAFRRRSILLAYAGMVAFPISVMGAYFFGLPGAVLALGLGVGVRVMLTARGIRKEAARAGISFRWKEFRSEINILWRFNAATLLSGAVYVPSMWLANLLMVNTPNGYAEMGLFTAADRWRLAIRLLPTLLGGVALPMLSSLSGASDARRFRKLLLVNMAVCCMLSLGAAVPIAALAPQIMKAYGSEFVEGRWVLVILCATAVMHAAYFIIGQSLFSTGRVWIIFRLNLGWAVLLLGTCWFLRWHGAQGLASCYLIADAFRLLAGLLLLRRLLADRATVHPSPDPFSNVCGLKE